MDTQSSVGTLVAGYGQWLDPTSPALRLMAGDGGTWRLLLLPSSTHLCRDSLSPLPIFVISCCDFSLRALQRTSAFSFPDFSCSVPLPLLHTPTLEQLRGMTPRQTQLCFPQWQGELQIPHDAFNPTTIRQGTAELRNARLQAGR